MILVTGASGQVGSAVVRRLVRRGLRPVLLARGRAPGTAEARQLATSGRARFVTGDLSQPGLGLDRETRDELAGSIRVIVNAAGEYRLGGDPEAHHRTNVDGMANLLGLGWSATIHHVSTLFAAGDAPGEVTEARLCRPVRFRNAYEASRWEAEERLLDARPDARVYRLAITVGSSDTGETQKFDGPYPAFSLIRRRLPFAVPGAGADPFPLVTVDLAADALVAGACVPPAGHEFLHVVDQATPTVAGFAAAMTERLAGRAWVVHVPPRVFLWASARPAFARLTDLPAEAAVYMCASTRYASSGFAAFCREHGIDARRLERAYDALVVFYALQNERVLR